MSWSVVIASNGYGIPVTESDSDFAIPAEIADNGYGTPVVLVDSGGMPVKGVGGGASPLLAQNNRVGGIGHSFIAQTYGAETGSSATMRVKAVMPQMRQALAGQIDYCRATIRGYSGETSTQILDAANAYAQIDADIDAMIAYECGAVFLAVSRNDPSAAISAATTLANTEEIIERIQSQMLAGLGYKPVIFLLDGSGGVANQAALLTIAQDARTLDDPANGIYVLPMYDALADAPDSLTLAAGYTTDNVHPSPKGSYQIAADSKAIVSAAMPAVDIFGTGTALFGGEFSVAANGGTKAANTITPTGNVPTGWTITAGSAATAGTMVCDIIDDGEDVWFQITCTGLLAGASVLSASFSLIANNIGLVTPGSTYLDTMIKWELDAGSENLSKVEWGASRQSGGYYLFTGLTSPAASDAGNDGSASATAFTDEAASGVLRAPHMLVDAGGTSLGFRCNLSNVIGQPLTCTLRFAFPRCLEYTGLLLD